MSSIIVQLFFKTLFVSYLAFIVFDNSHLKIRIKFGGLTYYGDVLNIIGDVLDINIR